MKKIIALVLGLALAAGAGTAFAWGHTAEMPTLMCHKGKTTLVLKTVKAIAAHMAHGDELGACGS